MNRKEWLESKSLGALKVYLSAINGLVNNGCLLKDENVNNCLDMLSKEIRLRQDDINRCLLTKD